MSSVSQNMLHNHFKPTKRGVAGSTSILTPKNDIKSNPFLEKSISSASLSTSSSSTLKSAPINKRKDDGLIYPCASGSSSLRPARSLPLPEHHSTLLSLHSAVEHALIVHLATSGGTPVDSAITPSSTIQLPCIITYTTLRPIVERSCGRRLGTNELSRLMWIWGSSSSREGTSSGSNIGFHITKGKTMDRAGNRSFDYFFSLQIGIDLPLDDEELDDEDLSANARQRRKRVLSGEMSPGDVPTTPSRKRIHPMDLPDEPQTPSPSPRSINAFARQSNLVTPPSSPSSIRSPRGSPLKRSRTSSSNGSVMSSPLLSQSSGRGLTSLVAMWNSGIDSRKREVRKRLQRWTIDCYESWRQDKQGSRDQASEQPMEIIMDPFDRPSTPPPSIRRAVLGEGGILTPSSTREDDWVPGQKRIIDLFEGNISNSKNSNRSAILRQWDSSFPLSKVAPIPVAPLPEAPKSNSLPPRVSNHHVLRPGPITKAATVTAKANASLSLTDRIKAKEEAKKAQMQARSGLGLTNGAGVELLSDLHTSRSSMMANLKRKSALSRLQDVAESLYMLFASKATSSASEQSSKDVAVKRYPLLPMNDVTKSICTSSKIAMSEVEARDAFRMLQDVAPGFLEINRVGAREWIRMGSSIAGGDVDMGKQGGILNAVRRKIRIEMTKN